MKKQKYILNFPSEAVEQPFLYHLVKNFDTRINILRADITPGHEGEMLVELSADNGNLDKALDYLTSNKIVCVPIEKKVHLREEECIHCGSCSGVCFSDALIMDKSTWKLNFYPENCTVCGLCIKACPLQLFRIEFGE